MRSEKNPFSQSLTKLSVIPAWYMAPTARDVLPTVWHIVITLWGMDSLEHDAKGIGFDASNKSMMLITWDIMSQRRASQQLGVFCTGCDSTSTWGVMPKA